VIGESTETRLDRDYDMLPSRRRRRGRSERRDKEVRWTAPGGERPLTHLPALDGIRGLAVLAVFLFHAGFTWAPGGFLGVSVFFTLSGYLITRLLLDDGRTHDHIDLLRFWARRVRRLLPAALVTIALVMILSATVLAVQPSVVRGDALAALGYIANWRFLFTGQSYTALFASPSPLLHFWSLAIEEQFYVVYPLVCLGIIAAAGRDRFRSALRTALWVGLGLSAVATVLAVRAGDADFVYYSTPTRAAELIAGALLACSAGASRLPGSQRRRWALPLGLGAIAAIAVLCATTTRTTGWVTEGGLFAFAGLSVLVIVAALPSGAFSKALAFRPLQALGLISYGVYLFHWPVILWLDAERVGLRGAPLAGVQAGVTLAIAMASYWIIEQPVRRGRFPRGVTARFMAPAAIAAAGLVVVLVAANLSPAAGTDLAITSSKLNAAVNEANEPSKLTAGVPLDNFTVPSVPSAPAWDTSAPKPRIGVFGDSTAVVDGYGLLRWGRSTGALTVVGQDSGLGCAIARGGIIQYLGNTADDPFQRCHDWAVDWPRVVSNQGVNVAVIIDGPFDLTDRLLPGDTKTRAVGDPVYDAFLHSEMLTATDLFLSRGVQVVWVTTPRISSGANLPFHKTFPESNPARAARFNQIMAQVVAERPGVGLADLRSWLRQRPNGELDFAERPDGVHFNDDAALAVAGWLGPAILSAARPVPAPPPAPAPAPG
jgi:peptidoglycan/LPS O-acetylase OafA/YrhL